MKLRAPLKPRKPKKTKSPSDSIDTFLLNCFFLIGIGLLFIITITIFCIAFLPLIKSWAWQETPCQILKSEVVVINEHQLERRNYNVLIQYKYFFNGEEYLGEKYNFDEYGSMLNPIMENIVARYPVGLKTNCFVNPENPTMAVLYRGVYLHLLFCLAPLGMLIFWAVAYFKIRKSNKP